MLRILVVSLIISSSLAQFVQPRSAASNVQAAQPDALDQIPAWYQMGKPSGSPSAVRSNAVPVSAQAAPSYYERLESGYEAARRGGEQQIPTYERPGIQTNQYANYPPFQNRQPYENLNALTSGASLSNLQASRRYPAASSTGSGSDPNTELLAAIKDVVAKFKASLDEAGIDQDVRQMGNQLKNTWQQLRTGTNTQGPMNEQIGRLFEKAVADAVDQKQIEMKNQRQQ